ncbi:MAG TPA: DUF3800 domain-containing protein [Dehalococcoidia bacterium]|nr:DUF3800 domain-containing protein [Dehalococcoidia bacterium]
MSTELFVYGDESGIDQHVGYVVVAGYIASPPQWDSFNTSWRAVLTAADDPAVIEFRSKPFFGRAQARNSRKNPFAKWSAVAANQFLSDLVQVCLDHPRVTPIGCAMRLSDWFSLTWGERQYLTGGQWDVNRKRFVRTGMPTRTYTLPFMSMIGEALENAKDGCKVHFVMDEVKVIERGLLELHARARTQPEIPQVLREKLGDLTPALSHEHEGIQAADLWAYTLNSWHQHREHLRNDRLRTLIQLTKRHRRAGLGVITRTGMERLLDQSLGQQDRRLIQAVASPAEIQRARTSAADR